MLLHHRLPSHMTGPITLLLVSFLLYSPQANALEARNTGPTNPGVCVSGSQCPSISGLNVRTDSETSSSITCDYSDSRTTCHYNTNDGSLITSGSTVSKCPGRCCADGYTFYPGSGGCVQKVTCVGGEYRTDSNTCSSCPNSKTSDHGCESSSQCYCAAGTSISGSSCQPCAAGKYSGPNASSCSKCPANYISGPGASGCTECPSGTTSTSGSSTCSPVQCAKGTYVDGHSCSPCTAGTYSGQNAASCSQCPANTFSGPGASSCTACPTGHTCSAGSTSSSQCTPPRLAGHATINGQCTQCPANTYAAAGATTCTECPSGQASNPGSSACSPVTCSAGTFIDGHSCSTCAAGTYSGRNAPSCSQCPSNTFSASGASSCTSCPSGHTCAPGSTSSSQCIPPCLAGHATINGQCTECPANTFAGTGATSCTECPGGQKSNPGSSACSPVTCAAGTFIDGHSCTTCTAGTYSGRNAASCSQCPANTFSASGASSCTSCPSGHTCAAGSTSSSQCTPPCLAGNSIKNGQCTQCSAGTYSSSPNSASCSQCPPNTYSGLGAGSCTACPTGHTCAAGSTSSSQCTPPACPAGSYLLNGQQCTTCPAGTFSPSPNSATCQECPEDTYSGSGATQCKSCDMGYGCGRRSGPGQCKPKCPAGSAIVNGKCTPCTAGTFSANPNSASCDECPEDTYSGPGATQCQSCDAGSGCDRRSPPGQCKPKGCPAGHWYGADHVCHECPRNTYGLGGFSPCVSCPSGQRAPRGSSSCTPTTPPSHRPRAQEVLTCPRDHMLCPIAAGVAATECVDVQNSLESCGGCVGMGTDTEGQDCSAIEHVADVSCVRGQCLVQKCRPGFEVSATGASCVLARKKAHDSRRLHY